MRKLLTLLTVIALLTSCKSENKKDETAPDKTLTEKIADEAGKIISEGVYEIKKGEKGGKVFIIEGTKLYAVGKNNSKDLFLEKEEIKFMILATDKMARLLFLYLREINTGKSTKKPEKKQI